MPFKSNSPNLEALFWMWPQLHMTRSQSNCGATRRRKSNEKLRRRSDFGVRNTFRITFEYKICWRKQFKIFKICLFVCLSVYQSICLPVYLSICISVCLSFCLSVFLSLCFSHFLSLSLSLSFYLSMFLSIFQSVKPQTVTLEKI